MIKGPINTIWSYNFKVKRKQSHQLTMCASLFKNVKIERDLQMEDLLDGRSIILVCCQQVNYQHRSVEIILWLLHKDNEESYKINLCFNNSCMNSFQQHI